MSDILCVTNRSLCREPFLERIERIAAAHPAGIILREKELGADEYSRLAKSALEICSRHGVRCILHSFADAAIALGCGSLHLPMNILRELPKTVRNAFGTLGASCHSAEEAVEAERLGCTYLTAGHIFDTDCKKDLPGRGLEFLRAVCERVSIPVYAIGGISAGNIASVLECGAAGGCVMSGFMTCGDPSALLAEFDRACGAAPGRGASDNLQ